MGKQLVLILTLETLFEMDSIPAVMALSELGVDLPQMIPYCFDAGLDQFVYYVREDLWAFLDAMLHDDHDDETFIQSLTDVLNDKPINGRRLCGLIKEMHDSINRLNLPKIVEAFVDEYLPGEEIVVICETDD